jgi:hypothetical protein
VIEARNAKAEQWEGGGREVPGVLPNVFFWTHGGMQTRAHVGLSRANPTEQRMACALANYLVTCGVPKSSIAILTPYKGQLLAIQKELNNYPIKSYGGYQNFLPRDLFQLSTVDRFQGDEADIVIISLVVDAKSRTPFVLLQNRMIVLLSRARIGMFIIGNKSYLDSAKDSAHWHTTLSSLQKPAPSDTTAWRAPTNPATNTNANAIATTQLKCVEYTNGSRIGDSLPICCPKHRSEKFLLTDCSQFSMSICKQPCASSLLCGHKCDLPCHFVKPDAHCKKCPEPIQSPCPKHARAYMCHEFVPSYHQETVEYRMNVFKCEVQISTNLACGHEFKFPCHHERLYADGSKTWPLCNKPSLQPFFYAACKHKWECNCTQFARATVSLESVPPCSKLISFVPACGHAVKIECYKKQQYESGQQIFVCRTNVDRKLPRCCHEATLTCVNDRQLASWEGKGVTETEHQVVEGTAYGPLDFDCKQKMKFIRKCGHHETLKCRDAFERALAPTNCNVPKKIASPFCGHELTVKCSKENEFAAYPKKAPIVAVKENDIPTTFNFAVKLSGLSDCQAPITVVRTCGHEVRQVNCCVASRGQLNACGVEMKMRSPLCGHEISYRCSAKQQLQAWAPWSEEFKKSNAFRLLLNESILESNAVTEKPVKLHLSSSSPVPICRADVTLRKACGHVLVMPCCDAFNRLSTQKLEVCREVIKEKRKDCNCDATIECHRYAAYQSNPASLPCLNIVNATCWNFAQCNNTVECECHHSRTTRVTCGQKSTWRCGECEFTITTDQCRQGVPDPCLGCHKKEIAAMNKRLSFEQSDHEQMRIAIDSMQKQCDALGLYKQATPLKPAADVGVKFVQSRLQLISKFTSRYNGIKPEQYLKTPLIRPHVIPVFSIPPRGASRATPGNFGIPTKSGVIANGVELMPFTERNVDYLNSKLGEVTEIVIGFAYVCLLYIWPEEIKTFQQPRNTNNNSNVDYNEKGGRGKGKGKGGQQASAVNAKESEKYATANREKWNDAKQAFGYHAVLYSTAATDFITFCDPFCLLATHTFALNVNFRAKIERSALLSIYELAPITKPILK